jgi:hypothetical protein
MLESKMERNMAILKKTVCRNLAKYNFPKYKKFLAILENNEVKVVCLLGLFSAVLWVLKTSDGGLGFVGVGFFLGFRRIARERKSSTYCSSREKIIDTLLCASFADLRKNKVAEFGVFSLFFFFRVY